MGSRRSLRERLLLVTLVALFTVLIVTKSPARVESRESSDGNAAQAINPGSGWEQAFRHLAVGP